jgi:hypothetical protein
MSFHIVIIEPRALVHTESVQQALNPLAQEGWMPQKFWDWVALHENN